MPTFYIASGLDNTPQVRALRDLFVEYGWKPAYDWTLHGNVRKGDGTPETKLRIERTAEVEADAVTDATVVVILLPGGKGTHVELGIAIGSAIWRALNGDERNTFIWSPTPDVTFGDGLETSVFYHHPSLIQLRAATTIEDVFRAVTQWAAEREADWL